MVIVSGSLLLITPARCQSLVYVGEGDETDGYVETKPSDVSPGTLILMFSKVFISAGF